MTPPDRFSPLALLGAGYIGGSVALAARRAGLAERVVGYDPQPSAAAAAKELGIVDETAAMPEQAVRGARLVVLAAPVGGLVKLLETIAPALEPTALVIDVGSVKAPVVAAGRALLPGRFVGCHPMAGTERSGPTAADAELFRDRVCFVCPGEAARVAQATTFWQALGARVVSIEAEPHDAAMAAVSHLPHVASFALAASLAEGWAALAASGPAAVPTTSLRDTTRIAGSSPPVWRDIFLENSRHLLPLVRGLEAQVTALRTALEKGDGAALEAALVLGRSCRDRIVKGG